jgi:hypothetical protein
MAETEIVLPFGGEPRKSTPEELTMNFFVSMFTLYCQMKKNQTSIPLFNEQILDSVDNREGMLMSKTQRENYANFIQSVFAEMTAFVKMRTADRFIENFDLLRENEAICMINNPTDEYLSVLNDVESHAGLVRTFLDVLGPSSL